MCITQNSITVFILCCVLSLSAGGNTSIATVDNECEVDNTCPPWILQDDQNYCVVHPYTIVQCIEIGNTSRVLLLHEYCITQSKNQTLVGSCPYYDNHEVITMYIPVPRNVSHIDQN